MRRINKLPVKAENPAEEPAKKAEITIDELNKIDLRVGTILEARRWRRLISC